MHEYLWSIDDVHFDQITFDTVAFPAALKLVRFNLESSPVFSHSSDSRVCLIDRKRDKSFDHSSNIQVIFVVGLKYPATRVLCDPADVDRLLAGRRLVVAHIQI